MCPAAPPESNSPVTLSETHPLNASDLASDVPPLSVEVVTDEYWSQVEPMLPTVALDNLQKIVHSGAGRGRKPVHPRHIFRAIIHVIVNRISWYELPETTFGLSYGTAAIAFRRWSRDGFFARLHKAGLAPHEQWEGIAWQWNKAQVPWEQVTLPGSTPIKPVKPRSKGTSRVPFAMPVQDAGRAA
ncbi:transposase [Verrucomicrobium sp. BvORR106]|uniref:transposase n=1 Tax=Verrucomicrobium sp. BvORR106 TaxID=1403819 RepID=UPI00068922AF|nr:transposase [Verrucomicrobium sp. BvORR106]